MRPGSEFLRRATARSPCAPPAPCTRHIEPPWSPIRLASLLIRVSPRAGPCSGWRWASCVKAVRRLISRSAAPRAAPRSEHIQGRSLRGPAGPARSSPWPSRRRSSRWLPMTPKSPAGKTRARPAGLIGEPGVEGLLSHTRARLRKQDLPSATAVTSGCPGTSPVERRRHHKRPLTRLGRSLPSRWGQGIRSLPRLLPGGLVPAPSR